MTLSTKSYVLLTKNQSVVRKTTKFVIALILVTLAGQVPVFAQKSDQKHRKLEISRLKINPTLIQTGEDLQKERQKHQFLPQKLNQTTPNIPQQVADNFLRENKIQLGLKNISEDLKIEKIRSSPGGKHIIYRAMVGRIPVYNSRIVLTVNNKDQVSFITNSYRKGIVLSDPKPKISSEQALIIARGYLDVKGFLHAEEKTELLIFESESEGALLAYRVELPVSDPLGDWEVFVEAASGDILQAKNCLIFRDGTNGRGAVWEPDPLSMAEKYYAEGDDSTAYRDKGDDDHPSLNNERVIVTLNELSTDTSGNYILDGPYIKLADIFNPEDIFPSLSHPDSFIYTRTEEEFEHVMVYYHCDQAYRRILELGFSPEHLGDLDSLLADPHGFYDDNSFYSPYGNFCAFGQGGVDDAEDASVIWHEYAHAIQNHLSIVLFSFSGETFSLLEGAADYWAGSYKRRINSFEWQQLFLWDAGIRSADGDTTFWAGRRCNLDWHYPEDYSLYDGTHKGGQIWSSALMNIWSDLGADVTDELFLQSHYYWNENPGFVEAAESFIQADRDLNDGIHLPVIIHWFDYHGFIDLHHYQPQIIHTPRQDSEDLTGPYDIDCRIIPVEAGLDTSDLWVVWRVDSSALDSSKLVSITEDYFSSEIPGTQLPAKISYYISVRDSVGQITLHPESAPDSMHRFYAGPDTISPVIEHQYLYDQPFSSWPVAISAMVRDNLGIDSVWVEYLVGNKEQLFRFSLIEADSGLFTGSFYSDTSVVHAGDTIYYRITARDNAQVKNISTQPEEGYFSFSLYQIPPPPAGVTILRNEELIELGWDDKPYKRDIIFNIYRGEETSLFSFLDSTSTVSYTDSSVEVGSRYFYYLTAVIDGWESLASDTVDAFVDRIVSVSGNASLPDKFSLKQNYPNPFNPKTVIGYQLPVSSHVELDIYNLLGQKVATLVSERQPAGTYQVEWDASGFSSGIYYYRLTAGEFTESMKLILLR